MIGLNTLSVRQPKTKTTIMRVGLATCGIAAGANRVYEALAREMVDSDYVDVHRTGCMGLCFVEPLVEVVRPGEQPVIYGNVTPDMAQRILVEHARGGEPIPDWVVAGEGYQAMATAFLARQRRIVLRNCGVIDPESIDEYIAAGGYGALRRALFEMTPAEVVAEVERSGLRGRGGAGFPTGLKWRLTRDVKRSPKYVICNADEGDPGAFMDRSVLESDPHSVIEGLALAAYAVGASAGFLYVRAEYPLAVQRLKIAVATAEERGLLGSGILGTDFGFRLGIREGAGAFVCGEETALMQSIEGRRGMPRMRPPYPSQSGLWGQPSMINNVETLANVPWIIASGPDRFAEMGTDKSKGTKVFALAGKVARGGLIEVPMGMTIREIVFDVGGGISSGLPFKAVQTGGPSGGCIPASLADTPVDYESLAQMGSIMGSGGLLVMDEGTCMVDVAKFFLEFTLDESCGKCTFCRLGTVQMKKILDRITSGCGTLEDLDVLEELGAAIKSGSLCGLGQTAPNPVLTTLQYFRDEYVAHVEERRCPAHVCRDLITYTVDADACRGCGVCTNYCPTGAIAGERKSPFAIDDANCTRCGLCKNVCKFGAIMVD